MATYLTRTQATGNPDKWNLSVWVKRSYLTGDNSFSKSMDQFELRTHKRLIDIIEPTVQTVDELKKLNLPAGVEININV